VINGGGGQDFLAGGFDDDVVNGGPGDDFLAGELPPDSDPPPPGVELPPPATNDVCVGAGGGFDVAFGCDVTAAVEAVEG
jgi:Ca2+-binding RTX toxin-like protein